MQVWVCANIVWRKNQWLTAIPYESLYDYFCMVLSRKSSIKFSTEVVDNFVESFLKIMLKHVIYYTFVTLGKFYTILYIHNYQLVTNFIWYWKLSKRISVNKNTLWFLHCAKVKIFFRDFTTQPHNNGTSGSGSGIATITSCCNQELSVDHLSAEIVCSKVIKTPWRRAVRYNLTRRSVIKSLRQALCIWSANTM